jgi:hypothetical protein
VKKILTTKKRIVIAVAASAVVLGSGGAAFAFYSSTGSGSGSATVGATTTDKFALTPDNISTALYPGDHTTVSVAVHNNATHSLSFKNITVTGASSGDTAGDVLANDNTTLTGCLATWFTGGTTNTVFTSVNASSDLATPVSVPVTFYNDPNNDQSACAASSHQGVKLTYSISNS